MERPHTNTPPSQIVEIVGPHARIEKGREYQERAHLAASRGGLRSPRVSLAHAKDANEAGGDVDTTR